MKVYLIKQNLDDFQYLIQRTESDWINTLDREGEPFLDWQEPTWVIWKKTKKDLKKRSDFTASGFFNGILLMQEHLATKMLADFNLSAQLLPINTPEREDKFVFVNILGGVSAVIESFWYTEDELWNAEHMPKALTREVFPELDGKYLFDSQIVAQNAIFRDNWFKGFYFCTDVFVNWATENGVKGLAFEDAGILKK